MSAIGRKALGDLARHRLRAALTVCTLSLALSSLAIAAVPGLMDRLMAEQIRAARLYDVAVATRDLALNRAQLGALGRLPNVAGFAASIEYTAQVVVGGQRQDATIWGLNFPTQPVDAVGVLTGTAPSASGGAQVLADAGNRAVTGLATPAGTRVRVRTATGAVVYLHLSGTAHSLATSPSANNGAGGPVFYAPLAVVRSLAQFRGVNYLAFRLVRNSPGAEAAAIAAIRGYLRSQHQAQPFVALPMTRAQGDWPDRAGFRQVVDLLYIVTVLALLSAIFLIVSTMNTLVVEQAVDIAILKTLGGRRRQIAGIVLRAAVLLGLLGAVVGTALGIGLAYLLTSYFASSFYDLKASFAVSLPVVGASLVLGPAVAVVASLPGLRRALRRPVAQTLADPRAGGSSGNLRIDRLLARDRLLPGPARIGVRNILRSQRRSAATIAQIAVATGLAIALFAGAQSVAAFVSRGYSYFRYDLEVDAGNGSALGARAVAIAASTAGVQRVEPLVEGTVTSAGKSYAAWGLPARPLYAYRLSAGRWFTVRDPSEALPPVVLGPGAAHGMGARVGQVLTLRTPAGPARFRIIGIDTGEINAGGDVYLPLAVMQRLYGLGRSASALWLTTASAVSTRPTSVNRVAAAVQNRLAAAGYAVSAQELRAQEADVHTQNGAFIAIIDILGLLVVAITLIGLVNALTMSVIERTREVGVLRSLGARPRQIRRVFRAEGVVLATVGWVIGVPLALLIARLILLFLGHDLNVQVPLVFPLISVPVALAAMVAITRLVIRPSLRRAARIQPATALRYE